MHSFRLTIVFACLLCAGTLVACSSGEQKKQERPPAPVVSTLVRTQNVPRTLQAVGNVAASSTVAVKSRIAGELMEVLFVEGEDVPAGKKLFSIDPRQNDAAVLEAEARLIKDRAQLIKAEDDLRRYETLVGGGFISREQYEQAKTSALSLRATVKADEAMLENVRLQRSYCDIFAPVAGRTGAVLVDRGNMVRATDDKALVVIDTLEPVYVSFSLPEGALAPIMERMRTDGVTVQATPTGSKTAVGSLTFVDSSVDAATGTIRMKASFPNKERALWPGQFVQVVVRLGEHADALVVPAAAVQTGRDSAYVYVVNAENKAELRPVSAEPETGGIIVLNNGVKAGERVVLEGHVRLSPGAAVQEYTPNPVAKSGAAKPTAPTSEISGLTPTPESTPAKAKP